MTRFLYRITALSSLYRAGFGDNDYGVGVVVGPTGAIGDFGTPQTFDSVVLINLSVGSHIGFCPDDIVLLVEVEGEVGNGNDGRAEEEGVCSSSWAWAILIIPTPNTTLEAATTTIANNDDDDNTIPIDLIIAFIVSIYYHDDDDDDDVYDTCNNIMIANSYCCLW
jgi:hypothetical protein